MSCRAMFRFACCDFVVWGRRLGLRLAAIGLGWNRCPAFEGKDVVSCDAQVCML